jgi:hypothetical protein
MYLAGHGSKTKPRLIELQYQRILRYRRAFLHQFEFVFDVGGHHFHGHLSEGPEYGVGWFALVHSWQPQLPGFLQLQRVVKQGPTIVEAVDIQLVLYKLPEEVRV